MASSNTTFAKRAKAIMSKYKNRLGENLDRRDPLAVAALNRELAELQREQEEVKARVDEQDMANQMAYGGRLPRYTNEGLLPFQQQNPSMVVQPITSQYYMPDIVLPEPQIYKNQFITNTGKGNFKQADINSKQYGNYKAGYVEQLPINNSSTNTKKEGTPWTVYAAAGSQVLSDLASAALIGNSDKFANTEYVAPQGIPYKKVSTREQERQLKEANINAKRSAQAYSGDSYMAQAIGQQADTEYQKGLGAVNEWRTNQDTIGENQYNQRNYEIQTQQAAERARVSQGNQAMKVANAEKMAYYLNKSGADFAQYPQTVAQMKRDKEMLPFLSSANYGTDDFGTFQSTVPGLKYYLDGKIRYLGNEVDPDFAANILKQFNATKSNIATTKPKNKVS
jgi:hypothetical protein